MANTYRTSGMQQIIAKLTQANPEKIIYQPEVGIDGDGLPLPFFALVDTLRIKISLPSLAAAILPTGFDDADSTTQRAALRDLMFVQSHILFELVLQYQGSEVIPAVLGCINSPPFYHFSLLNFLTDAAVWPVAAGVTVLARVRADGWGGLGEGDSIEIFGSARTEAPSFSVPPQTVLIQGTGAELPANTVYNGANPLYNGENLIINA
jgi:hypothetical protein